MSSGGDKDKTVIGGALPGGMTPMPGGKRQATPNQSTVIGGPLPGAGAPGGFGSGGGFGAPQPGGFGGGGGGGFSGDGSDAWNPGGGGFGTPAPQPGQYGGQQGGFGNPPFGQPPAQRTVISPFGGAQEESFFPDTNTVQPTNYDHAGPKIDLRVALSAKGLGAGGPKSPMLAAAANLLILFGRLRTQMVEMEARPLMEYVTREIEGFEKNCLDAGVDPHETQVAKYLLCSTADDIVQNIPSGTDRHVWIQYAMTVRFFNRRTSGVGFFQEVEKALQAPAQRFQLLELAMTCLSLGFEGQYRTAQNGAVELSRIRSMIYESLRRVQQRPDDDISPRWQPVLLGGRRRFGGTPLWVIGSVLGTVLMGAYFGLSMLISGEGNEVSQRLLTMNPTTPIELVRTAAFTPMVVEQSDVIADPAQLERLKAAMAKDIDDGIVTVDVKGDYIFVRVSNAALFASGKAVTKPEFNALGERITTALNAEPGPVLIYGYTDNVPMNGRGKYKNNHDLSLARAEAVKEVLAKGMTDPTRFVVEGKGEADPIGDNGTNEGKALNRRVEIMIKRQETLGQEG